MKKKSEAMPVAAGAKRAMRSVLEVDLRRLQGGAGNAAIDFAIKPPRWRATARAVEHDELLTWVSGSRRADAAADGNGRAERGAPGGARRHGIC